MHEKSHIDSVFRVQNTMQNKRVCHRDSMILVMHKIVNDVL